MPAINNSPVLYESMKRNSAKKNTRAASTTTAAAAYPLRTKI
jgi:hypothetical protein